MQKLIEVVLLEPGVGVGGDRDAGAGVDHPARVGIRLPGREVCRREEGGDGVAGGQRLDVGVVEVGAVVHRCRAHLHREPDPGTGAELVSVHPQAEARRTRPASRTARDCSASKAPSSQKTSIQRDNGAQAVSISPQTSST